MEQLLRDEGYIPYGDESATNESVVTVKNYTRDAINEERTVWIEKNTNFSQFDEHRVTVLGRRHEIQGLSKVLKVCGFYISTPLGAGQRIFLLIQVAVGFLLPLIIIVVRFLVRASS